MRPATARTDQIVGLKLCDLEKFSFFESRFKGMDKPTEGDIAAMMDHPNIIKTLEYGLSVKNEPYLVMEFIDGPGRQYADPTQGSRTHARQTTVHDQADGRRADTMSIDAALSTAISARAILSARQTWYSSS